MWVDLAALLSPGQGAPPGVPADTGAVAPPGLGEKFTTLLAGVKWIALAAIILTFFVGVAFFTAGRIGDHRGTGERGTRLMVAAGGGAVLFAVGYGLITGLAGAA